MGDQFTVYFNDNEEELAQWVKDNAEVFGGKSDLMKRAVLLMREEKDDAIQQLREDKEGELI